jgi:hypothetical protein
MVELSQKQWASSLRRQYAVLCGNIRAARRYINVCGEVSTAKRPINFNGCSTGMPEH